MLVVDELGDNEDIGVLEVDDCTEVLVDVDPPGSTLLAATSRVKNVTAASISCSIIQFMMKNAVHKIDILQTDKQKRFQMNNTISIK